MKKLSVLLVLLLLCGCSASKDTSDKTNTKEKEVENVIKADDKASDIAKEVDDLELTELESGINHYSNDDIIMIADENDEVSQILYKTDKYSTEDGSKVGDSFDTIDKLYKDDETKNTIFDNNNKAVCLTVEKDDTIIQYDFKDNKVISISITDN